MESSKSVNVSLSRKVSRKKSRSLPSPTPSVGQSMSGVSNNNNNNNNSTGSSKHHHLQQQHHGPVSDLTTRSTKSTMKSGSRPANNMNFVTDDSKSLRSRSLSPRTGTSRPLTSGNAHTKQISLADYSGYGSSGSDLVSLRTLTPAEVKTNHGSLGRVNNNVQFVTDRPHSFTSHSLSNAPRSTIVKSTIGFDRSRNLRAQVETAMRDHKIYSCVGVYPAVRKALQKRGWVEKSPGLGVARSTNFGSFLNKELNVRPQDESDSAWMSRVLRDYPPDFNWIIRRDNIDWRSLHKDQIVNRHPRANFTTKVGIATCVQSMQWFSEPGISETFFPRCYRLCLEEEKGAFIDDYCLSACMGLLKWIVGAFEVEKETGVVDPNSTVDSSAVDFAIRQVNNYVRLRRHEDLDSVDWLMPPNSSSSMGQHWDAFLHQYYTVVFLKAKMRLANDKDSAKYWHDVAKRALQRIAPYWPQLGIDGTNNVWICKPGARSRGKGIVLMNQLDKILDLLALSNSKESNWVVQKYIERPMLIYKTKFDIRQWFIVSDWQPLTVWFYKDSYIRFCTKPFSLVDFHESIHLCNNAVQCRYQNAIGRDHALPNDNMWDNYTFQAYLKTLGKYDLWDDLIYPGMKQGILGIMLASQENVEVRRGCFELYGADFMLSEDFQPWLIEINSSPCMAATTNVTARLCGQCLEDMIKVIVDRREDKNAPTGMFELIYKQNSSNVPSPFNGTDYALIGKKLVKDIDWPSIMTKYNSKKSSVFPGASSTKLNRSTEKSNSSIVSALTFRELVTRLRLKDVQTNSPLNGGTNVDSPSGSPIAHQIPNASSLNTSINTFVQSQSRSKSQHHKENKSLKNTNNINNSNKNRQKDNTNEGDPSTKKKTKKAGLLAAITDVNSPYRQYQRPIANASQLPSYHKNVDPNSSSSSSGGGGHMRSNLFGNSSLDVAGERPSKSQQQQQQQHSRSHSVTSSTSNKSTAHSRSGSSSSSSSQNHHNHHGQSYTSHRSRNLTEKEQQIQNHHILMAMAESLSTSSSSAASKKPSPRDKLATTTTNNLTSQQQVEPTNIPVIPSKLGKSSKILPHTAGIPSTINSVNNYNKSIPTLPVSTSQGTNNMIQTRILPKNSQSQSPPPPDETGSPP